MRKGRKKLVGAVLLGASVVGGSISLPQQVIAAATDEVSGGIPFIGQGNKTQDHHTDHHPSEY